MTHFSLFMRSSKSTSERKSVRAIAIEASKLGVLENRFQQLHGFKLKRDRRHEYNELVSVLKGLKLLDKKSEVVAISYGIDESGELKAFILLDTVEVNALTPIPEQLG